MKDTMKSFGHEAPPLLPPSTPYGLEANDGGGEPDAEEVDAEELVPRASTGERAPANVSMVDLVDEPPSPNAIVACAPKEPRARDDVTRTGP